MQEANKMDSRISVPTPFFVMEVTMHDDEVYVFKFDWPSRGEVLRTLGRFASNPELSLTWDDATYIASRLREVAVW